MSTHLRNKCHSALPNPHEIATRASRKSRCLKKAAQWAAFFTYERR